VNQDSLQISSYDGEGYKPLLDYGDWRVAVLRYLDALQPDQIDTMERHTQTDEVFVLLEGRAALLIGGNGPKISGVEAQDMEIGKVYNVKQHAWHNILLSRDATVLLVENNETGQHNSEFRTLSVEQRREIVAIAAAKQFA
jgi:ureidoglycolate hydrolase